MSCLSIRLVQDGGVPSHFADANGMVFLDTNPEENIFENKNLEELNDISKISIDGIRQFSLPDTPLNRLALYDKVGANTFGVRQASPVIVDVAGNGNVLRQHLLYVLSYDKKECIYQVELRNGDEHWLTCIDRLALCDVDIGKIIFSFENILMAQKDNCTYQDGGPCYNFPDAYYGGWLNPNYLTVNDYRPWFHLLGLLQKIFCQCGWAFRSPVFETDYWRHFITYLAPEKFNEQAELLNFRRFRASIDDPNDVKFSRIFFTEEFDNGNNYDDGYYIGTGEIEVCFNVRGDMENTNPHDGTGVFSLVIDKSDGTTEVIRSLTNHVSGTEDFVDGVTEGFKFKMCATLQIDEGDRVYVRYTTNNNIDVISITGDFYSNPIKTSIIEGDEIDLKNYLDCDITALDYFKGALHLIDGKILTDFKSKTVTVFTPYDATWNEELAEGYFTEDLEITEITDIVECDSDKLSKKDLQTERYVRLQFAKTNDQFIEDNFDDDSPPLSKTIDFGEGFAEKTRANPNPLFEPTEMDVVIMPSTLDGMGATRAAHLPILTDNDKDEVSYDLGPRLLYSECFLHKITDPESGLINRHQIKSNSPALIFSQLIEGYSYAYSYPLWLIDDELPIGFVGYGEDPHDFYTKAYARTLLERYFASKVGFNLCTDINRCSLIDFRKKYLVKTDCDSFIFHVSSIANQVLCGKGLAGIVGIPSLPFNACDEADGGISNMCNQNNLMMVKTQSGNDFTFSIEGNTVSTVEYQTVEWKLQSDDTYTEISSPYTISDPSNNFLVRLTYKTEGCPEKSVTTSCSICRDDTLLLSIFYDQSTELVSLINENDPFFNVAADTVRWSTTHPCDDPDYVINSTIYTDPFSVPEDTTIYARRLIDFTNDCPELTQCVELMVPPSDLDCTQNDFSYECIEAGGNVTFEFTGEIFGKTQFDAIYWRPLGSSDPFKIWDCVTPLPCPIEHYRSVIFCDDLCPPYCSPTLLCDCDMCMNDGEINDTCIEGEASATFTPSFSETPDTETFEIIINGTPQSYIPGDIVLIGDTDAYSFRWTINFPICGELIISTIEQTGCCQLSAGESIELSVCN